VRRTCPESLDIRDRESSWWPLDSKSNAQLVAPLRDSLDEQYKLTSYTTQVTCDGEQLLTAATHEKLQSHATETIAAAVSTSSQKAISECYRLTSLKQSSGTDDWSPDEATPDVMSTLSNANTYSAPNIDFYYTRIYYWPTST